MYNYLLRTLFVIDGLQDIIKWLCLYEYSVKVSVDDTVHKNGVRYISIKYLAYTKQPYQIHSQF